jgi:glutamate synthase domain-containing protein 2
MVTSGTGPDFIAVDGGEGGTGAAPPSFADHVSLPFYNAFAEVYQIFQRHNLTHKIVFIASGKLGLPSNGAKAFALGADVINVAREAMMSIGCIQAQLCHTNHCPTGIATQSKWLQNGIDPTLKSNRFYNYAMYFRKELLEISKSCGYEHPCEFKMTDIANNTDDHSQLKSLKETYHYEKDKVAYEGNEILKSCPHLGGVKAS